MATNTLISYVDVDMGFQPNPITGDISIIKNENAIKQSIKNLIETNFYEKPFQQGIGSGVTGAMFENYTPALIQTLTKNIENCIKNYEPRAQLLNVDITIDDEDNGLLVNITFVCVSAPQPVSFSIPLIRAR